MVASFSGEYPGADLHGGDGEELAGAGGVGFHLSMAAVESTKPCTGGRFPVVGLEREGPGIWHRSPCRRPPYSSRGGSGGRSTRSGDCAVRGV